MQNARQLLHEINMGLPPKGPILHLLKNTFDLRRISANPSPNWNPNSNPKVQ